MSAIVPRLELRQGQSLVMTQQLQQSIKLLQLSSQELQEYVEQELEKNPLLMAEDEGDASVPERMADDETPGSGEDGEARELPAEVDTTAPAQEDWQGGDDDGNILPEFSAEPRTHSRLNDEYADGTDAFGVSEVSLREHLLNQLSVAVADPAMRMVGQYLIDLVDESGYIKEDISALQQQLDCDGALIESVFCVLHGFDPSGVCARSLKECLSLQLQERNRLDPAMQSMLEHLDLVAAGKHAELGKLCGVDGEDIREMCAEIRALNPRPGALYQHEPLQSVVPDVLLRRARADRWQVELNPAALPRVLVNRPYYAQLTAKALDKVEKKYVTEQLAVAHWLVKALDQRAQTILKVSTEIVAQQDAFFRHGIRYLRPLTLKEVAAATGLHESTVSRVTNSKYISTPRGTFELKYFFNAAIQNASGGEGFSNKTVQYLIKEIVDKEPPAAPYSDDAIAEQLKARGIEVARRTISKYRDIMNIPSSSQRRKRG